MEQMTAASTLAIICNNKAQNASLAEKLMEEMENGNVNPLQAHVYIKSIEDLLSRFFDGKKHPDNVKRYRDLVATEAVKYGKSFDLYDVKFQVRETGQQYDWESTQDSKVIELMAELDAAKAKLQERQDMLKMLPASGLADPETGNMIYPPSKTSTTSVVVTLK
jgi:hypothetical protein